MGQVFWVLSWEFESLILQLRPTLTFDDLIRGKEYLLLLLLQSVSLSCIFKRSELVEHFAAIIFCQHTGTEHVDQATMNDKARTKDAGEVHYLHEEEVRLLHPFI